MNTVILRSYQTYAAEMTGRPGPYGGVRGRVGAPYVSVLIGNRQGMAIGDFNGDGLNDIATSCRDKNSIDILTKKNMINFSNFWLINLKKNKILQLFQINKIRLMD